MISLKSVLETYEGRLTAAERRLVQVLLSSPAEAAMLSAAELSARAAVHQATAVRLAQKLGYRGYPELRTQLQADLLRAPDPATRIRRRLARADDGDLLSALVQSEVDALRTLPGHVTQAQLDEAARLLIRAGRVFLFAQGHATSLVDLMDRRLRRSGFDTVDLRHRRRDLAEHLLSLRPSDALLAFAFHREPPELAAVLEHAREVGAPTVLISDLLGSVVRPAPTLTLAAPRGAEAEFQTLCVPMAICNALVLTVAKLDEGTSVGALERLAELLERFEGDPGNPQKP